MIIIRNNFIPFNGFKCINIFGVIFARKGVNLNNVTINHELIHTEQIKEMFALPFYFWYCVEFLIKLVFIYRDVKKAYLAISFEREARLNQGDLEYIKNRHLFGWLNFIRLDDEKESNSGFN